MTAQDLAARLDLHAHSIGEMHTEIRKHTVLTNTMETVFVVLDNPNLDPYSTATRIRNLAWIFNGALDIPLMLVQACKPDAIHVVNWGKRQ